MNKPVRPLDFFRSATLIAAACLTAISLGSVPVLGQSGAIRSGIRGRVVVAKELRDAKVWPIKKDNPWYRTAANVRRSAGQGEMPALTEPAPRLEVVLEGAEGQDKEVRVIAVEGLRFSPASVLVPSPARFKVLNRQQFSIRVSAGPQKATIAPGKFAFFELEGGLHDVRIHEIPAALARVRVLDKALVLPVEENGLIKRVTVEGGRYKLSFYHGAEPLAVQEIGIPDSLVVAVDVSISANRVVTVSVKDGGLTAVQTKARVVAPEPKKKRPKSIEAPDQAGEGKDDADNAGSEGSEGNADNVNNEADDEEDVQ